MSSRPPAASAADQEDQEEMRQLKYNASNTSTGDLPPGSLWLGLAESTRTADETLQCQSEKRIALHVTLASIFAQSLTFIGWRNPPVVVAYVICAVTGVIIACVQFFRFNDWSWLRLVNVASGLLFSLVFFFSAECRIMQHFGAMHLTAILPSLIFHSWMGGEIKTQIAVIVAQLALFVIFGIVEGSTSNPCYTTVYPALTDSAVARTFLFAVIPMSIVIFGVLLVMSAQRIRAAGWAFTERTAIDLARYIREHDFAGARSYVAAATSGRDAQMSLTDLVMCAGVTHAAMFEEISLVPATVEEQTPSVGAIKELRRGSLSRQQSTVNVRSRASLDRGESTSQTGGISPTVSGLNTSALRRRSSASALHRTLSMASRRSALGRSESQTILPQITSVSGFMLMLTLPSFHLYAHRQQSSEMQRLLLGEYFDAVSQICDIFDGKITFSCFTDIYIMFEQANSACAAALAVRHLLEKEASHHRDLPFLELQPTRTLGIIFHTNITTSTVGSDKTAKLGCSDGQILCEVVKSRALRTTATLPLLLIATRITPLVTKAFEVHRFDIPKFHRVGVAKEVNELGYPSLPADPPPQLKQAELEAPLVSEVLSDEIAAAAALAAADGAAAAAIQDAGTADGGVPHDTLDASGPTTQTRARLNPEVAEVWRKYDTDRSGLLDVSEMRELLLDIGIEMADEELQRFFDEVDRDHNGSVSQEEFAKAFDRPMLAGFQMAVELRKKAQQMRIQNGMDNLPLVLAAWKRYDIDGNGSLTSHEIEHVLKDLGIFFPTPEHVEWFVERFDQNGSGTIELDEFASLFSESSSNTQLNAAKARIQTVTRVLSNKQSKMTYATTKQEDHDALIRFFDAWVGYASLPLFMYIVYNFFMVGYRVSLGEHTSTGLLIFDMLFDILYYVWFALKLLYLPRKKRGQFILEEQDIRQDYMNSIEFVTDIVVVVPLDFAFVGLNGAKPDFVIAQSILHGYFRINKLFSMYHIKSLMDQVFSAMAPSNQTIVVALMWYFYISHVFACAFLVTARIVGDKPTEELTSWNATIADPTTSYLQGILWALLTLAGQVKGVPVPNEAGYIALLFVSVFVGIPLFGIMLGVIGNAVTTENGEARFRRTIDELKGYFQYTELPAELEAECIAYYRHMFTTTGSLEVGHNPLTDMPVELTVDVTIAIGKDILEKVHIFKTATENVEFVHELTSKLIMKIIEPRSRVMRKGERGTNMSFIQHGYFNIVVEIKNKDTGEDELKTVFTLRKGNFFGEIALLQNVKRTATIYCGDTYANVLVLEKRDFDQVAAIFPDCVSKIYQRADSRLKELREQEAKEAREAKLQKQKDLEQHAEREKVRRAKDRAAVKEKKKRAETTSAAAAAAATPSSPGAGAGK